MKSIQHFAKFLILCITIISADNNKCLAISFIEYPNKQFVVSKIAGFEDNVSLLLVDGISTNTNLLKRACKILPYYPFFGLTAVQKLKCSSLDISTSYSDIVFLYRSDLSRNHSQIAPEYDRAGRLVKPKGYCPSELLFDSGPRLVFAERCFVPDATRMLKIKEFSAQGGTGHVYSYDGIFKEKGIDKPCFLSNFSNTVYKICDGGLFAFNNPNVSQCANDGRGFTIDDIKALLSKEIIDFSSREASEIVYWLWKRDGKVGKYPELCKRHPELFEPISGLDDFKTEIGRMLVERSKQ